MVESGEGALVHDQRTGIQRQPAAIAGRDPVGDHGVSVQLRVEGPAGVLTEQPHHDPLGVDRDYLAVAAHSGVGVGLDPAEHRLHRPVMRLHHRVGAPRGRRRRRAATPTWVRRRWRRSLAPTPPRSGGPDPGRSAGRHRP